MITVFLLVFCFAVLGLFRSLFLGTGKIAWPVALLVAFCFALGGGWATAFAGTQTVTSTTLVVTSGGAPARSVAAGRVVTLTASVTAGGAPVTVGQVNFCDALATYCTDIHVLGTAQLTSAGIAVLNFRPGIGSHSYKAVFVGTNASGGSASGATGLTVTGAVGELATATSVAESGSWGNYTLTATVTGFGGTATPTGTVSFLDRSNENFLVGEGSLGTGTAGIAWPSPQELTMSSGSQAVALGDFNGDGIPDLVAVGNQSYSPMVILLGNADGTYTPAPKSTVPSYNFSPITVADFNGDGKQDIAGLSIDLTAVIILLGNGDGTFNEAPARPAIADLSNQLAVGDFNGDGIPDLAVGNTPIQILLGNGDGTFTAVPGSVGAIESIFGMVVGDFNTDGKLDLAFTLGSSDIVSVALGNGDGTFNAATNFHSGSANAPLAVADFNGDGKLDLAVGASASTAGANDLVTVLLGNGDGTFVVPAFSQNAGSISISSVRVGDFNGDGVPDLMLTDSKAGTFTVFTGSKTGSFTAISQTVPAAFFYGLVSAVGDVNGDGRSDLLIGNGGSDTVSVYLTAPTETGTASGSITLAGTGQHLVAAKYDGDSTYTSSTSGSLALWGVTPATTTTLSLSSGGTQVTSIASGSVVTFTATVTVGTTPATIGQVNFCDASASACSDIHLLGSVALATNGTATFKYVPGPGTHSYKAEFVQDGYGSGSASAVVTLNVGPAPSVVYTNTTTLSDGGFPGAYSLTATVEGFGGPAAPTGNVSFLDTSSGNSVLATAALGASTSGLGWLISQTAAAPGNMTSEVTGDFNGDGVTDLAILSADVNNSLSNEACTIFFGKGDGTFTAGPTTQTQAGAAGGFAVSMIAGDFNADGKVDLALLSYPMGGIGGDTITTFLGNGDGTFVTSTASSVYNQGVVGGDGVPGSMTAADFNGDGKPDLAVVGDYISNGGATILLGNGDGTFAAEGTNLSPNADFGLVATGDFNGDGIPDLVATNYFDFGSSPTIFLGKGDGTFTAMAMSLTLDYFPTSIVVADFNGDGLLDLAFSDLNGVEIAVGNGDGTFKETAASPIAVNGELYSLVAGDFNHDGKLDLAGIDTSSLVIDLLLGAGDGTFTTITATPAISQDFLGPFSIVATDFNQDGVPDLAMLTKAVATASILLTEPTETATATVNDIVPIGAGRHNVEASYAGDANYSASVSGTVALTAAPAPVVFSPASGTYSSMLIITLSESVPGATIYYLASGAVNTNGFVPYTAPIQLTEGGVEVIQAYATETGYQQSNYTTATYTLNLPVAPTPVFSPAAGSYAGVQSVTISDSAPGATIYYTTNGSLPTANTTASSTQYTGPIAVTTSETLLAIAVASGYSTSAAAYAQYIIGSSPSSFIYTLAGNGFYGYSGDGGLATFANVNQPSSSVVDSAGNLYIADSYNNVIRKVAAGTGIITTIAGTGTAGYSGDNGAATSAQLYYPTGLSLNSAGDLYFADEGNNVVRMIAAATGVISTVGGNGTTGYTGDDGAATSAQLSYPEGTVVDSAGNLYIADTDNCVVREVAAKTGIITTVAGSGAFGYGGDGGPATAAELGIPRGVAVDAAGNLYIADTANNLIRKVTAGTGVISTVAGSAASNDRYFGTYSGDSGPATSAQLYYPEAVTVDRSGNLYIADTFNDVIREVTASNGVINTIAGSGPAAGCSGFGGDGGPAIGAVLCYPSGISLDAAGNLYIADAGFSRIRVATAAALPPTAATAAPTITVPAGTYAGPQTVTISDSTPGASIYLTTNGAAPTTLSAGYNGPINVTGNVTIQAIAVAPGHLVSAPVSAAYTITSPPTSVIHTFAGTGVSGSTGAGGPANAAQIGQAAAIAIDKAGDLFFSDITNNVVWEITAATGNIAIVAGNGSQGFSGDGGPATSAQLSGPYGVAVDGAGNLYIADSNNNVVREVFASTGRIETVAGIYDGFGIPIGDGGPANSAHLGYPQGLAVDAAGNLYIADSFSCEVRVVSAATGIITSFAGSQNCGFSGEGGAATSAGIGEPNALAFDSAGNLYIGSSEIGRVFKVASATGILTTVAGNGNAYGGSGDGGAATSAEVFPQGLAPDTTGNLYIANSPGEVREVSASTGIITKVVGNGYPGYSGDGGSASIAQIQNPQGIVFDASGNLYIADGGNFRVREVSAPSVTATPVISPAPGTYTSVQTATITDGSQGAIIYYTTDGTTPTSSSSVYSGSIAISATTTLQAIAIAPGFAESAVASATYTLDLPIAPTVTATPSATSITTAQALSVAVTVAGPGGSPTPTGSVTLSGGSYSAQQNLASGTATFRVAAGALPVGTDTLTASYSPDAGGGVYYTGASQSATVTVTQAIGAGAATVTLTPSATTVTNEQPVSVAVSVAGASGQSTPTGTVTLAGGSYSMQQALSSGATTFSIPAGAIGEGAITLTASYSGDVTYASASGTTTVTVAAVLVTAPNPSPVAPGSSTSATATFSAGSTYSGTMNLTCTLTASPTGAQSLPTCSQNPTSIAIAAGGTASTVVTVKTTAASGSSALLSPGREAWKALSGGGVVALALLLGVPSWRRRRAFLMVALFGVVVAGIIGCGGGGSHTTPPPTTPATTAGTYTFSVIGTDSSNSKITASTNVTVTVQ